MNRGINIAHQYSIIRDRLIAINQKQDDLLKQFKLFINEEAELLSELKSLKKKYPELTEQLEKEHD